MSEHKYIDEIVDVHINPQILSIKTKFTESSSLTTDICANI